jgi:N6-L-threonylcarbamoyladenine synthase
MTWEDIDAIAVTYAPGLVGSLLIGTLAARTLAILKNKPLYPIHHVEAHVYANFLNETPPEFPILALIVSGGHSQIVIFRDHGDYELIGQTQDDAIGEAFDKVAKIIGLPYPGGPSIAKAALDGDPLKYKLPKAKLQGAYDFSFSGLKTAVLRAVQREVDVDIAFSSSGLAGLLNERQRNDFAASFQHIAVETLVDKVEKAYVDYQPKSVVIAGGVAANSELRRVLSERLPIGIQYAPMSLCTDNAAMIATLGYYQSQKSSPIDPRVLEVMPSLSMAKKVN